MKYAYPVLLAVMTLAAGCATTPEASFYLVPDPDGKVGEVTVTNEAGSVVLNKANESVDAPSREESFTAPREATAGEIQAKFGDALGIMPPPPKGFNVYFDSGSSKINAESAGVAEQVMAEVKKRDSRDISLNGHTDRVGDNASNMKLSLERADTVKKLLVDAGIDPEYIQIEYYGESKPVVKTEDEVDEPLNRRVEVVVR